MALRAAVAAVTAVGVGGVMFVTWPGTASADVPVSAVSWWTQSPAPPTVPSGGISVATGPGGEISVAAVRVDTGGGASSATLTLDEDSGQGQQAAAIEACATTNDWQTANGGAWADRPPEDCRNPVPLTRDANGRWTGDVAKLLSGKTGPQSVMVVPTPAATGLGNVPFQIAFKAPTVAGTTTSSSGSDSSGSGSTSGSPATSTSGDSSSSQTATGPGSGTSGGSSFGSTSSFGSSTPSFGSSFGAGQTAAAPSAPANPPAQAAAAPQAAPQNPPASADAAGTVPFVPRPITGGAAGGGHHIGKGMVLLWLAIALMIGAVAAAGHWASAEGYISTASLVAAVRTRFGRRPGSPSSAVDGS